MGRVVGSTNLFKGSDLQRAVRSARAAGLIVARVEIDKSGKIAVVAGEPAAASADNPWDTALALDEKRVAAHTKRTSHAKNEKRPA